MKKQTKKSTPAQKKQSVVTPAPAQKQFNIDTMSSTELKALLFDLQAQAQQIQQTAEVVTRALQHRLVQEGQAAQAIAKAAKKIDNKKTPAPAAPKKVASKK